MRLFPGIALLVLAVFSAPRRAHACDCLRSDLPASAALSMAAVVVEGLVSESRPDAFVLQVVTAHKGGAAKQLTVHTEASDCGYQFQKGERVLIYAPLRDGVVEVAQCRAGVRVVWGEAAARESQALRVRDAGR